MSSIAVSDFNCHTFSELCAQLPHVPLPAFDARKCALTADAFGRFHVALGDVANCPATLSIEAALCAGSLRHRSWGAALIFYDVALQHIAASGGAWCFDSWWRRGPSAQEVFAAHGDVLMKILSQGPGPSLVGTPIHSLSCPVQHGLRSNDLEPFGQSIAQLELRAWGQEVSNAGRPLWRGRVLEGGLLPKVSCLVPLVWPSQEEFLTAILETYGADCDALRFFVSTPTTPDVATTNYSIVNLHAWYPHVPPDDESFHRPTGQTPPHDTFNTIVKLLHMPLGRPVVPSSPFGSLNPKYPKPETLRPKP